MHREKMFDLLNEMEHAMTEVDLILWTWQTDLDMMSFIGQDSTKTYIPDTVLYNLEKMEFDQVDLTVKRVPLVRYEGDKRIVIGVADVDEKSGVYKATVQSDYASIFTIPGAYSIRDGEPPEYDHALIKSQLKRLAKPEMYVNPFRIQGVTTAMGEIGENTVFKLEPIPAQPAIKADPENHPFFQDAPGNLRCNECKNHIIHCTCELERPTDAPE